MRAHEALAAMSSQPTKHSTAPEPLVVRKDLPRETPAAQNCAPLTSLTAKAEQLRTAPAALLGSAVLCRCSLALFEALVSSLRTQPFVVGENKTT